MKVSRVGWLVGLAERFDWAGLKRLRRLQRPSCCGPSSNESDR